LLRIETSIDAYGKQWVVEIERRLMKLDWQMARRFKVIVRRGS